MTTETRDFESLSETDAESEVLAMVRRYSRKGGTSTLTIDLGGMPCLRYFNDACHIIDVSRMSLPVMAKGETWREILFAMYFAGATFTR
jgi:hypothetical protein